ncbi:MAG TPA: class I SAM-dependent methyltransferase, partial [Gemmataceae bacterium]|nr:class I SAM-dependent methyltransferase [Gemmataceae bacterium]
MPAYEEDLAYIHDVGFGHFAKRAAPAVLRMLRQSGITKGLVVDLGCGSGIWARELTSAGYDVLGVDISQSMLALARQKAPHARFVHASLLKVTLPACAAVTSIGECVNYLFDARNNQRELARFFARVYQALRAGGTFIFDSLEPGQVKGPGPRVRNAEGPDWATLVQTEEDTQKRLLT